MHKSAPPCSGRFYAGIADVSGDPYPQLNMQPCAQTVWQGEPREAPDEENKPREED